VIEDVKTKLIFRGGSEEKKEVKSFIGFQRRLQKVLLVYFMSFFSTKSSTRTNILLIEVKICIKPPRICYIIAFDETSDPCFHGGPNISRAKENIQQI